MKGSIILLLATLAPLLAQAQDDSETIDALLVTGGGHHDYENQKVILTEGLAERIDIDWSRGL